MKRRLSAGLIVLLLTLGGDIHAAWAKPATPDKDPTLAELLRTGLRARRQVEFDFIDRVALFVDMKKIPKSMVRSTLLWARKKPIYPFQYFERAIKLRAAKIGVIL